MTASARLTEPEWTGLTLLMSMMPELLGRGSAYGVDPGGALAALPSDGYGGGYA